MRSDLVFLFSSTSENPDRFFQGYFFHDADYVFGEKGFEAFRRVRGVEQIVREDGCYVQAEKADDGYYWFSGDYHGYKKLFYFWDSGFWVVSNSLFQIVTHIRQHGFPVVPEGSQLAAMATEGTFYPSGRGSFFSQLTSFDTIIQGVRLVPADCILWIGSAGVRLEKTAHQFPVGDYRYQLRQYMLTWIGRLHTLASESSVQVCCDLTGGLDSRAVFSLLLSAIKGSDVVRDERVQIRCGTGRGSRKDHAIATRVCRHLGLSLNGRLGGRQAWLNGRTSFALWKDLCLGVYHPIYLPNTFPTGSVVHLGGGGGENHRHFYGQFLGAPAPDTFVARRAGNIAQRSARQGFEISMQHAIDSIMEGSPDYLDVLTCHYRHFRNRFHAGREPQYNVTFQPLASKMLDGVAAVAGKKRFRNAQMHYDILYNLAPELLHFSFDSWRKRAGRSVRRNLASIAVDRPLAGRCFIEEVRPLPAQTRRGKEADRAIDFLSEEFCLAKAGFAAEFLGTDYVRTAERSLQTALLKGDFSTPTQSKRVAVVMACAIF